MFAISRQRDKLEMQLIEIRNRKWHQINGAILRGENVSDDHMSITPSSLQMIRFVRLYHPASSSIDRAS